jgi:hypothetical protein
MKLVADSVAVPRNPYFGQSARSLLVVLVELQLVIIFALVTQPTWSVNPALRRFTGARDEQPSPLGSGASCSAACIGA